MKTSLLIATLLATGIASASFAAPQAGNATLNPAAAQAHHIQNLHKYGGPKANPGKLKVPQTAGGLQAGGAAANFDVEPCGNGIKPIPGVGPQPGLNPAGGASAAMADFERCGTRVPGRIPGGFGPGPR